MFVMVNMSNSYLHLNLAVVSMTLSVDKSNESNHQMKPVCCIVQTMKNWNNAYFKPSSKHYYLTSNVSELHRIKHVLQ